MTEVEKIAYTRMYIEKLANGINPLTDQAVPDTDLINNVRISRCLFYVSDLLRQLEDQGGIPIKKTKKKAVTIESFTGICCSHCWCDRILFVAKHCIYKR